MAQPSSGNTETWEIPEECTFWPYRELVSNEKTYQETLSMKRNGQIYFGLYSDPRYMVRVSFFTMNQLQFIERIQRYIQSGTPYVPNQYFTFFDLDATVLQNETSVPKSIQANFNNFIFKELPFICKDKNKETPTFYLKQEFYIPVLYASENIPLENVCLQNSIDVSSLLKELSHLFDGIACLHERDCLLRTTNPSTWAWSVMPKKNIDNRDTFSYHFKYCNFFNITTVDTFTNITQIQEYLENQLQQNMLSYECPTFLFTKKFIDYLISGIGIKNITFNGLQKLFFEIMSCIDYLSLAISVCNYIRSKWESITKNEVFKQFEEQVYSDFCSLSTRFDEFTIYRPENMSREENNDYYLVSWPYEGESSRTRNLPSNIMKMVTEEQMLASSYTYTDNKDTFRYPIAIQSMYSSFKLHYQYKIFLSQLATSIEKTETMKRTIGKDEGSRHIFQIDVTETEVINNLIKDSWNNVTTIVNKFGTYLGPSL